MHPPIKDHTDIGVDNPSIDASDSPTNKDQARQEFKDEADINYMLSRFGITQPRGAPQYGTWDDTIDLQIAIEAVREAQSAYADLPDTLRNKFGSMEDLLRAVNNGTLVIKNEEAPEPKKSEQDLIRDRLAKLESQKEDTPSTP